MTHAQEQMVSRVLDAHGSVRVDQNADGSVCVLTQNGMWREVSVMGTVTKIGKEERRPDWRWEPA